MYIFVRQYTINNTPNKNTMIIILPFAQYLSMNRQLFLAFPSALEPDTVTPQNMSEVIKTRMNTIFTFVFYLQRCIAMLSIFCCFFFRKILNLLLIYLSICLNGIRFAPARSKMVLVSVDKLCLFCHKTGKTV